MRNFINLRYKFLPYLYNLFYTNHQAGEPILRPLFYEFNEEKYFNIDDAFMVGPFILQAPVLENKVQREVNLPKGYWFDYLNNKWINGGRKIKFNVPLNKSLLFIRDGAIIPVLTGNNFYQTEPRDFKNVIFNVFIKDKKQTSITYYEDDGQTNTYKNEIYNLTKLQIQTKANNIAINIQPIHRQYPEGLKQYTFNIILNQKPNLQKQILL